MTEKRKQHGWRWHYIKRVRDGKYFCSAHQRGSGAVTYKFTSDRTKAKEYRLKMAMHMLCHIRRRLRLRERHYNLALREEHHAYRKRQKRPQPLPPELLVLEVKGDPNAEINYPWKLPD